MKGLKKRNKHMEKLKQYWLIILMVLIVIGGLFYWYEWRPSQIRKDCSKETKEFLKEMGERQMGDFLSAFNVRYKSCITINGIKE